jgi:ketosteroid isomerase-like protein
VSDKIIEDMIRELYRARMANDAARTAAFFSPDACLKIAGSPDFSPFAATVLGEQGITRVMSELIRVWEWLQQDIQLLLIKDDRCVVHYELQARFIPTGEVITTELVDLIQARGNKISEFVQFLDTAHLSQVAQKS